MVCCRVSELPVKASTLVLAVVVALLASCPLGALAARAVSNPTIVAVAAPGIEQPHRQLSPRGPARALQQQTCTCPAVDEAKATCQQASQEERDDLLRAVAQHCTRIGFAAPTCCPNMPINDPKWTAWAACLCAEDNVSLTAFVDGPRIVQTCGCWGAGGTGAAGGTAQPMSGAEIIGSITSASAQASASAGAGGSATSTSSASASASAGQADAQQVVADLAASYQAAGVLPLRTNPGSQQGGNSGQQGGSSAQQRGNSNSNTATATSTATASATSRGNGSGTG